eukprot:m.52232 g.52232  ORF g.52232 m.52232 type:complete len:119 (+) comp15310_c0_seq1:398-754(+)
MVCRNDHVALPSVSVSSGQPRYGSGTGVCSGVALVPGAVFFFSEKSALVPGEGEVAFLSFCHCSRSQCKKEETVFFENMLTKTLENASLNPPHTRQGGWPSAACAMPVAKRRCSQQEV